MYYGHILLDTYLDFIKKVNPILILRFIILL